MKLGQPLAKEIRHVIYGSNQPFLQKPGIEMGFSGERLCLMVWISLTSQRTDKVFETFTPAETLTARNERDADGMKQRKMSLRIALWRQRPEKVGSPWRTQRTKH